MHRACALFERDVIAQQSYGIALQEWMLEYGARQFFARERRDGLVRRPPARLRRGAQQILGDDKDVTAHLHGCVDELGMKGDAQVGWNGPGGGGPNQTENIFAF